jgi:hypothetical protein
MSDAALAELMLHAKSKYGRNWSRDQAETALANFLQSTSVPILAAAVQGASLEVKHGASGSEGVVLSTFIIGALDSGGESGAFIEAAVKGGALAAVLYYPDINAVGRRFDNVAFYFDTAFLLRALGYTHLGIQLACTELLDLLYGLGGKLHVFEHTVTEMTGVLHAAIAVLADPRRQRRSGGEAVEYFLDRRSSPSDVELVIATLDKRLQSLRISVVQKPSHSVPLGLDEDHMAEVLQEEVGYHNPEAREKDIDSLAAIHRCRGRTPARSLERSKAVFVSTNVPLARASARFFKEEYEGFTVPLCILDHDLATLAWLKNPVAAPDLPIDAVAADCYAALNPSDSLWRKYLAELARLEESKSIDSDSYALLRYSLEARVVLMDVTLGDPGAIVEGTVTEVLERARSEVARDLEAQIISKQEATDQLSREKQALSEALTSAEVRHKADLDAARARVGRLARRSSQVATRTIFLLGGVVLAVGAYASYPLGPAMPSVGVPRLLIALATVLVLILSIANLLLGVTLRSLLTDAEDWLSGTLERRLAAALLDVERSGSRPNSPDL